MTTTEEIERIVLEVVRRLWADHAVATPTSTPSPSILRLGERVVAMETIAGRLEGVRELIVGDASVVTPSVRDELQTRQITLVRDDEATPKNLRRLWLAQYGNTDMTPMVRGLRVTVESIRSSSLAESIASLSAKLEQGACGLVATETPEAAVYLANRYDQLRAFWTSDAAGVHRALTTMNANVMILDATLGTATNQILVRAFASLLEAGA